MIELLKSGAIVIEDGAMGTMVQQARLSEEDYRGERFRDHPTPLEGCTDGGAVLLECLEQMDDVERVLADRANEYEKLSEQINSEKQTIAQETEENSKRLAELDNEWKTFSSKIDPQLLKIYIMVRDKAGGIAVAPVKDAVCYVCNMNIPSQMYNDLRRCDSLKFCPSCQRIIYWKDT